MVFGQFAELTQVAQRKSKVFFSIYFIFFNGSQDIAHPDRIFNSIL